MTGVCFAVPDALTAAECAQIVATSTGFAPTGADYPPDYRNNDRLVRDDPALAARLFAELGGALPATVEAEGASWELVGLNERFRLCRYRDGQGFRVHRDGAHARSPEERSLLTLQIYLDEGFTGGRTRFYATRQGPQTSAFTPRQGLAIVFDHQLWHDGEPVTVGTKHVMRTDVVYRRATAATPGHVGYVLDVLPLADGRVASASRDRTIRLWRDGRCERVLTGHGASVIALAQDGEQLWSASRDHTLRRWDLASGRSEVVGGHAGAVLCLTRLHDGRMASGGGDNLIRLQGGPTLAGHAGWVWDLVEWRPGLLVSASQDGTLRLWPDGRVLAPGRGPIQALARIDENRLAAGCADGSIVVYDLDGGLARVIPAHRGEVYALCTTGRHLASGGEDDMARVWELETGQCVAELAHGDFVRAIAPRDADTLVTASYDGQVRHWTWRPLGGNA